MKIKLELKFGIPKKYRHKFTRKGLENTLIEFLEGEIIGMDNIYSDYGIKILKVKRMI